MFTKPKQKIYIIEIRKLFREYTYVLSFKSFGEPNYYSINAELHKLIYGGELD